MRLSASASRLKRMLRAAGVDLVHPDATSVRTALDVYREFCEIRVSGLAHVDGDTLLAQYGTFSFTGHPLFSVDLTRQFIERGEDPAIWQLSCTFEWTPTDTTDSLGSGELWSDGPDRAGFFSAVPSLDGFDWALGEGGPPASLSVQLERV